MIRTSLTPPPQKKPLGCKMDFSLAQLINFDYIAYILSIGVFLILPPKILKFYFT